MSNSLSESAVMKRTFSSFLDEVEEEVNLEEVSASDNAETQDTTAPTEGDEQASANNRKDVVSIPNLKNIERFIRYNCHDQIVAAINEKLYEGEMSAILRVPVLAHEIKRESCMLEGFSIWRMNQTDFLVDVDITLTNILVESKSSDQLCNFKLYVTFWFTTCLDFDYEIQDVGALIDRPERNLIKMDSFATPILSSERIDAVTEDTWEEKVPGSLMDADKRRAYQLAAAYGLNIMRLRLADRPEDDHILFFQPGTIMVQDPPRNGSNKLPPPRPEDVPADTIVLNTAEDWHDDYALAIYKACFEYEWYYTFFALNNLTDTRLDLIPRRNVKINKKREPRDPLAFISGIVHRGGFALMMPLTVTRDRIWREYQRVSAASGPCGYANHAGWKYEQLIPVIAEEFCLKPFRVRQRAIQMGLIAAKGALNFDPDLGHYFVPFAFSLDEDRSATSKKKVRRSEALPTYSITRRRLLQVYRNNPSLRKLMATGEFVFMDGLVCVNDTDFIQAGNGGFRMTPSANADVSTCCLRFHTAYAKGRTVYQFDKSEYRKYAVIFDRHSSATINAREETRRRLLGGMPESFPDTLKYLMRNRPMGPLSESELALRSGLSEVTISLYCRDPHTMYRLEELLLICAALNLPPWLSGVLLERANISLERTGPHAYCSFILDCLYLEPVRTIQAFLKGNGFRMLAADSYQDERKPTECEWDDEWGYAV